MTIVETTNLVAAWKAAKIKAASDVGSRVLLVAKPTGLTLACDIMDLASRVEVPALDGETWSAVVSHQRFEEMLKVAHGETAILEPTDNGVSIRSGRSSMRVTGYPVYGWPRRPPIAPAVELDLTDPEVWADVVTVAGARERHVGTWNRDLHFADGWVWASDGTVMVRRRLSAVDGLDLHVPGAIFDLAARCRGVVLTTDMVSVQLAASEATWECRVSPYRDAPKSQLISDRMIGPALAGSYRVAASRSDLVAAVSDALALSVDHVHADGKKTKATALRADCMADDGLVRIWRNGTDGESSEAVIDADVSADVTLGLGGPVFRHALASLRGETVELHGASPLAAWAFEEGDLQVAFQPLR